MERKTWKEFLEGGIKMLTNEQWANRIDGNMKPVVLIKDDTYVIWNNIGVSGNDHVHQIIGSTLMEYEERRINNITSWDISREYWIKDKIFKEIISFYDGVEVVRYYIHTDVLKRKLTKEEIEFLKEVSENGKIYIRDEGNCFEFELDGEVEK